MMRLASKGVLLAATALAWLTAARGAAPESRITREYVNAAAQSDMFERLEAMTVLAHSQNPAVRAFAEKMLSEHASSSDRLRQTAVQAGFDLPQPGISGDQSAFLAALQSAWGTAFDRLYARQQALAHRAALATQDGYVRDGDVPLLKEFATNTAVMVRSHVASADQLVSAVGSD